MKAEKHQQPVFNKMTNSLKIANLSAKALKPMYVKKRFYFFYNIFKSKHS